MESQPTWKPIDETGGRYEVSDAGEVRVVRRDASGRHRYLGHVLKTALRRGYPGVTLTLPHGRRVNRQNHILVARAFLGEPAPKHQCNHKDGDKANPRLENLEYVTASQNYRHALDVLGHQPVEGETHWSSVMTDEQIRQIRLRRAAGEELPAIAKSLGKSDGWICQVCTGRTRASAGGPLTRTASFKGNGMRGRHPRL